MLKVLKILVFLETNRYQLIDRRYLANRRATQKITIKTPIQLELDCIYKYCHSHY